MNRLSINKKAPDFTLFDQNKKEHSLSDYTGQWVLLYFYPKDDTPGCTKEACSIRDDFPRFKNLKARVIGISADTVESHKKFADKYNLPFTLLADTEKKVLKLYGVWGLKKFLGKEYYGIKRMSFLINPEGKIAKIYNKVVPIEHSQEVIDDLSTLK